MRRYGPALILVLVFASAATYVGMQFWLAYQYSKQASVFKDFPKGTSAEAEKVRQEAIALRIENERRTLFWTALSANISAAIGIMLALFGAWMSFRQFLQTRDRERLDRASTELNTIWQGLTNEKAEVRAASIAALQQFLTADREEYHPRVIAALALSARSTDELVSRTATAVVKYAFEHVKPEVLREVSWRGLHLVDAHLAGAQLSGLDLRDAVLEGAMLRGADLRNAKLTGANLKSADLSDADLTGAELVGATLTHASLKNAMLGGAKLGRATLLLTNLQGAKLRGARLPADDELRLALRWRDAELDPRDSMRLVKRFGPHAVPPRVLMLMWEFPPFVTGGAWTAAFHLLSELRRGGADVTVIVPWPQSLVDESIFGGDVEVIGVGSEELAEQKTREFFYSGYSGYGGDDSNKLKVEREIEGAYSGTYLASGHSLMRLVTDFRDGAATAVRDRELAYDVVHAHDWLALEAAMPLARNRVPLVAHIHSTERDRRHEPGKRISAIEKAACAAASAIIVPSGSLRETVLDAYAPAAPVHVVGNSIGETPFVHRGQFGTGRVIFLGRLTWQKGPDVFVEIAHRVREGVPESEFFMFGDGDLLRATAEQIDSLRPIRGSRFYFGHADYLLDFERVRRIEFDPASRRISPGSDIILHGASIARSIFGEFTIVPVQGFRRFTHRLSSGQNHFLIATDCLPTYEAAPDRFVVLAGTLEWAQRHRALDETSILVVPSRSEPFGMVVLEAMLGGVPVVCSDVAGVLEYVEPAATFNLTNVETAGEAITRLLTDEGAWSDAVERQRASVERYVRSSPHEDVRRVWRELRNGSVRAARASTA